MIEYVKNRDKIFVIIVRNSHIQEGLKFFTSETSELQIGCAGHKKNSVCEAHIHNRIKREVFYTSETLIIKKGKVRADIYDSDKTYLESVILESGDVALFADGGHGYHYLEDTQLVEIKQGPYPGTDDKVRFKGITEDKVTVNDETR